MSFSEVWPPCAIHVSCLKVQRAGPPRSSAKLSAVDHKLNSTALSWASQRCGALAHLCLPPEGATCARPLRNTKLGSVLLSTCTQWHWTWLELLRGPARLRNTCLPPEGTMRAGPPRSPAIVFARHRGTSQLAYDSSAPVTQIQPKRPAGMPVTSHIAIHVHHMARLWALRRTYVRTSDSMPTTSPFGAHDTIMAPSRPCSASSQESVAKVLVKKHLKRNENLKSCHTPHFEEFCCPCRPSTASRQ